jgi:hypothetical protein
MLSVQRGKQESEYYYYIHIYSMYSLPFPPLCSFHIQNFDAKLGADVEMFIGTGSESAFHGDLLSPAPNCVPAPGNPDTHTMLTSVVPLATGIILICQHNIAMVRKVLSLFMV